MGISIGNKFKLSALYFSVGALGLIAFFLFSKAADPFPAVQDNYSNPIVVKDNIKETIDCADFIDPVATSTRSKVASKDLIARHACNNPPRQFISKAKGDVLDIVAVTPLESAIEVLVRASRNGKQLGFGSDGTIETERIIIYNPPVLTPDGTKSPELQIDGHIAMVDNYHDDPGQALQDIIEHTVSIIAKEGKQIKPGSVGNTTSVFYPAADAAPYRSAAGTPTFTTTRTSAGTGVDSGAGNYNGDLLSNSSSNTWGQIIRRLTTFDTASIPDDDVISSVTLSYYGYTANTDTYNLEVDVVDGDPASNTAIVTADYLYTNFGTTPFASIDVTSWNTAGYNDFTLDANGIANVSKTSYSRYGTRLNADTDNVAPSWVASSRTIVYSRSVAQAGTTNDPKLTVEHAAAAGASRTNVDNVFFAD